MTQTVEVERKWVLPGFHNFSKLHPQCTTEITQFYIDTADGGFRIRDANGECTATMKSAGDVARVEDEVEIPRWLYNQLASMSDIWVKKTRWMYYDENDVKLELDCYHDDLHGLVTIEAEWMVEIATDDSFDETSLLRWLRTEHPDIFAYTLPEWLGETREVSYEPRYKNASLARYGVPV